MRLRSVHPGVSVEEVVEQTGFELARTGRRVDDRARRPMKSSRSSETSGPGQRAATGRLPT